MLPNDIGGMASIRAAVDETPERQGEDLYLADGRPIDFSDEAVALQFSARHADTLRYVAAWGRWLIWEGTRWKFDETLRTFDFSRAVCRANSSLLMNDPKQARLAANIASAKTVAAVVSLARADRRHAATVDQWDASCELLNTPAGIVDLRTGHISPHRRSDYHTKITPVAPGGACPLWLSFLDRIMAGDREMIAYLQRVAGYALTGLTHEHALFFGYGTGANGKGVFIGTLAGILGDYAATAPMETFTVTAGERHPTDLAGMRGARLVTAQETEQGKRWSEARIKALTGGDRVSARFMRQDFFEYIPQFKLLIAGNHKPGLRAVDEAIRRRLHLIPFNVTIPVAERDKDLPEKLKAEWPGILAWAIEGCLEWRRVGLSPPKAVQKATEDYLAEEDTLRKWLDDCCDLGPAIADTAASLFASWRNYAAAQGEEAGSSKAFSQRVQDHLGFEAVRDTSGIRGRGFKGLKVKVSEPPPPEYGE